MKALERISNILGSCDNLFYTTPLVDINEFIFSLLQRKFSYKTHENIWILKKNLFYCFHKFNFRKIFEPIPVLSVKDLSNMTPFQRIMYTEYIKFCPKIEEQFLANYKKNHEKEYIDEILHTLGKYKSIKDKGCYSYEILRKLFSECKILIRCNKFSYEQLLKFYSLNDEIIYNSMSSKERKITLKNGLAQMKMLNQMVKCILYLSFYFNDYVFKQYVNNEINITEVSFFHSNNETAKMIYRNCTHILLFCRTIHQKCVLNKKVDLDEPGHSTEKMTQSETFMAIARIKNLIDKYHNKIMFMSTDITALTLNDPDSYIYGLKRCFRENSHIYLKLIQNSVSSKSLLIFDEIKEMYNEIEEVYQQFFLFEIQGEEIERQIIESIERFFELIGQSDFVPPFSLDGPNLKEKYKERDNKKKTTLFATLYDKKEVKVEKEMDIKIRILVNKIPFVFTLLKSLSILIPFNPEINPNQTVNDIYIKSLFRFLGYYVKDNSDNCLMIMTERLLKVFRKLNTDHCIVFINLLDYMVKHLSKSRYYISQNNELMKVIEDLITRISDRREYVTSFHMLLKIIGKLSKMNYIHQEHTLNKIRKSMKKIYKKNPILKTFRETLINERKSLKELMQEGGELEGYDIQILTILFTKFLKIINYLFDGNSTLNEVDFLKNIFTKEQIPIILKDLTIYLPLRIELLKFFRVTYVDVLIVTQKTKKYVEIFQNDIRMSLDPNAGNFIFFQDLLKVKDTDLDMSIDSDLLNNELKNFPTIAKNGKDVEKNIIVTYFEEGIILPLQVFTNKYISIVYNLDGLQYIKLYEIVLHFLQVKKYILEEGKNYEQQVEKEMDEGNIFKSYLTQKKDQFSLILDKIHKSEYIELIEDIKKIQDRNFDLLNYKLIYHYFKKHVNSFIKTTTTSSLKTMFSKRSNEYSEEEIEEKREEYKKSGYLETEYGKKLFDFIIKYENDKINFTESSLSQNLAEKNVLYDATYRSIMLRPIFYLINSENLYLKYRRQNLWYIFRMLQYDTGATQEDILNLRKADLEKLNKKKKTKIFPKNTNLEIDMNEIKEENDNNENNDNEVMPFQNHENYKYKFEKNEDSLQIKPTINLYYLIDLFIQNLLSIIFESCNPSTTSTNEDYTIAYMVIKIMKYMCEDHNIKFQTIFFQEISIDYGTGFLNMFDLMMACLTKILVLAKWNEVTFDSDEGTVSYYYEIFFCMIEFSIEMIQGTSRENTNLIIPNEGEKKDENSLFYKFLLQAKGVLKNNANDSETLYNVRNDIISFIQAFIEEKSTPEKVISVMQNLFNPVTIFECIVSTLKKLYLKNHDLEVKNVNDIEFDKEKCEEFTKMYFSNSEFSKNQEFDLANKMYNYVKQLSTFNNKDANNIIESQNIFTEEEIIELRKKREDDLVDDQDNSNSVLIESSYYQNYFAVKFFEAITRTVWIQGEDDKIPQMVLFTLDPTVLFLSENSKNDFYKTVPRDTRSSKLFALMEYTNYFFLEINQNKKRLNSSIILRLLNHINFNYIDYIIYAITATINIIIFIKANNDGQIDNHYNLYKTIFPLAIIQLILTLSAIILWVISKFGMYFVIEKEKYYTSNRISREQNLTFTEYLDIIILKTILSRRELVNFIWDLIFSILGISSRKQIFVFSIQLLILVNISSTLQKLTKAIAMRYSQLLTCLAFLIIAIYIFSTVAFVIFSKNYIHTLQENQENTCGGLFYCFLTHMEFGLRTDGGIGEFIQKISFPTDPLYFMGMFMFQFIFYLLVIVIMLQVIGGSVIDTFAELREKSQEDAYDMNNVCFICNGTRNEIEKQGEVFEDHISKVHNIWTYVDYMIGLKFVDPQETNAINSFVIEQLEDKKISWFPSFIENDECNDECDINEG